ncbi:hypothetical protein DMI62_08885 [Escherichia coli]|nr:hypothetical protein [Escherichia coli]
MCARYWVGKEGQRKFTRTKTTVLEAVKRFAENGKALAVGVILGVGALIGWRHWNSHQVDSASPGFLLSLSNAELPQ